MPISEDALPLADTRLMNAISHLLRREIGNNNLIKTGSNEARIAIETDTAAFLLLAADTDLIDLGLVFLPLCEPKNIPYTFVPSGEWLGRATGTGHRTIVVTITTHDAGEMKNQIERIKDQINRSYY